jgi:hypothetical protein
MPDIIVTSPHAGDILRVDATYEIKWESIGTIVGNVKVSLRESSGSTEVIEIDDSYPNTGSYFWKVPLNLDPDTDYFIRVESLDSTPIVGDSADFEVTIKFSISEFSLLEKFKKLVLVEMKAGFQLETTFLGDTFILKEDGDYLLLESGDKIILEQSIPAP